MGKKIVKAKVGSFVHVKEKAYRHVHYDGVVTESFSDMIQIYGNGYRPLGFHEFNTKEIEVTIIDREKLKFLFDQELRDIAQKTIRAEMKFKEMQSVQAEASAKIGDLFK